MKKLPAPKLAFHGGPVRLYRADVEHLADLLGRVDGALSIRHDGYEFESVDELRQQRGPLLRSLQFLVQTRDGSNQVALLEFDQSGILRASTESLAAWPPLTETKIFLETRCERTSLSRGFIFWTASSLSVVGMGSVIGGGDDVSTMLTGLVVAMVAFMTMSLAGKRPYLLQHRIVLQHAHEHVGPIAKYGPDLVKGLIGATVGYVIGLLQR